MNVAIVALLLALPAAHDPFEARADAICARDQDLDHGALVLALKAFDRARRAGEIKRDVLTLIDYSRPSREPRLWVIDLARDAILFRELVAHGKNSGGDRATSFSNTPGSLKSSLGLFVTRGTYQGEHGYSMRLKGLQPGINDQAESRAIVIHGAEYVRPDIVGELGRLGRSWGCPALPTRVASDIIDHTKGGTAVFAYYPDPSLIASIR